jgi:hypothetical protein
MMIEREELQAQRMALTENEGVSAFPALSVCEDSGRNCSFPRLPRRQES